MNTQIFCVQTPSVNATWLNPLNAGRNNWNIHANFPGTISSTQGCLNLLNVGIYGQGWLGLYTPVIVGSRYQINLDSSEINSHVKAMGYTFANVVTSTTAHEYGHALKLDHTPTSTHLMSHNRNRNVVTGPTTGEVNESNGYY